MDTSDWIALGAFALSAVGAVIALWQAGIASRARADAQQARDDAAGHEQAALAASQKAADAATRSADEAKRSADALEESNALVRAQLTPPPLWILNGLGGDDYELVSNMVGVAQYVSVGAYGSPGAVRMLDQSDELVRFGDRVRFRRERRLSLSRAVTLVVDWHDINLVPHSVQIHLP